MAAWPVMASRSCACSAFIGAGHSSFTSAESNLPDGSEQSGLVRFV